MKLFCCSRGAVLCRVRFGSLRALDQFEKDTGLDIPIHVDGASGAFLAPFCAPDLEWDFALPRVRSINASGHKFGLAPLGVGWVMWREEADLPESMIFWVNYLGGNMKDIALNFSRPGGQIVCQYYNFLRLGREGYEKVHGACTPPLCMASRHAFREPRIVRTLCTRREDHLNGFH